MDSKKEFRAFDSFLSRNSKLWDWSCGFVGWVDLEVESWGDSERGRSAIPVVSANVISLNDCVLLCMEFAKLSTILRSVLSWF